MRVFCLYVFSSEGHLKRTYNVNLYSASLLCFASTYPDAVATRARIYHVFIFVFSTVFVYVCCPLSLGCSRVVSSQKPRGGAVGDRPVSTGGWWSSGAVGGRDCCGAAGGGGGWGAWCCGFFDGGVCLGAVGGRVRLGGGGWVGGVGGGVGGGYP